jgi:hypothetical protein
MARIALLGSQPGTNPVAGQPLAQVPQVKQLSASSGETGRVRLLLSGVNGSCVLASSTASCIDLILLSQILSQDNGSVIFYTI